MLRDDSRNHQQLKTAPQSSHSSAFGFIFIKRLQTITVFLSSLGGNGTGEQTEPKRQSSQIKLPSIIRLQCNYILWNFKAQYSRNLPHSPINIFNIKKSQGGCILRSSRLQIRIDEDNWGISESVAAWCTRGSHQHPGQTHTAPSCCYPFIFGPAWAAFTVFEGKFCTLKAAISLCPLQSITLLLPLPTSTPSPLEVKTIGVCVSVNY